MATQTVKQQLSFQLRFMALMLLVGRTDEAAQAAAKLEALIAALPDDLSSTQRRPPMPNPFAKSRPAQSPYAIYRAGDMIWHVAKTYKQPSSETKDPYARWFVWAKSDATFGSFEGGDTYRQEVIRYGHLVAAEPAWLESMQEHGYISWGHKVPTPAEYLANA